MKQDNDALPENLGIEEESGNENVRIAVPFKPEDISIQIIPRTIGQLVEMLEDNDILKPRYQRLPNLWNGKKKSRFIESLMLGLPIPLFYFDEGIDKRWYVVDGLQRMSTLEHFILGEGSIGNNKKKFTLENLEYLSEYDGKTWDDLPKYIRRSINTSQVTINLIGKGTPDEVKYTIFSRINQGDVPLKPQEIRTALFQGYRVDFLESLVSKNTEVGKLLHQVTVKSLKSKRQEDLDFISRFIAFYLQDYGIYEPDMDRFITSGTKLIPEAKSAQQEIVENLKKALNLTWEIFGEDSFRKRTDKNARRVAINKPLFEVVSTVFAKLGSEKITILKANREYFRNEFIELQNSNKQFFNAITTGTATKENVNTRNKVFRDFLNNFCDAQRS